MQKGTDSPAQVSLKLVSIGIRDLDEPLVCVLCRGRRQCTETRFYRSSCDSIVFLQSCWRVQTQSPGAGEIGLVQSRMSCSRVSSLCTEKAGHAWLLNTPANTKSCTNAEPQSVQRRMLCKSSSFPRKMQRNPSFNGAGPNHCPRGVRRASLAASQQR